MNRTFLWLGCAALMALFCAGLRAAEPTIAVADMEHIFKEHQRLKAIIAQINAQRAQETMERLKTVTALEQQQAELRQLNVDAQNPALTETVRNERRALAVVRLREFRVLEARIMHSDEASHRQLTTRMQELRKQYFVEIQEQVRAYAAEQHLALVLDSSNLAAQNGIGGGVLHAASQLDITAAIIVRVNSLRPPVATVTNAPTPPKN